MIDDNQKELATILLSAVKRRASEIPPIATYGQTFSKVHEVHTHRPNRSEGDKI